MHTHPLTRYIYIYSVHCSVYFTLYLVSNVPHVNIKRIAHAV